MSAYGLSDAQLLDLTLAAALFSALAIVEPISVAAAFNASGPGTEVTTTKNGQAQSALQEELAV
jgi:hypothetical protein